MKDMEQPINQTLQMEDNGENLYNGGIEDNTIQDDRDAENSVSQISDKGSINFGKFKDAESLLKAYNSLQTEFTKKSQRLSELENSKEEFSREEKINKAIEELKQNYVSAQKFSSQIKEAVRDSDMQDYRQIVREELIKNLERNYKSADEYIGDEKFLNEFVYSNSQIRENIIRDYLSRLTNTPKVKVMSNISGSIPISPPNVPATIQEAGRLAKNIIKQI